MILMRYRVEVFDRKDDNCLHQRCQTFVNLDEAKNYADSVETLSKYMFYTTLEVRPVFVLEDSEVE